MAACGQSLNKNRVTSSSNNVTVWQHSGNTCTLLRFESYFLLIQRKLILNVYYFSSQEDGQEKGQYREHKKE